MAYGDYQHCAVCGAKTFYDANIGWDCQHVPNDGYSPDESALKSLCKDCAKTHEVVVVKRAAIAVFERAWQPSATLEHELAVRLGELEQSTRAPKGVTYVVSDGVGLDEHGGYQTIDGERHDLDVCEVVRVASERLAALIGTPAPEPVVTPEMVAHGARALMSRRASPTAWETRPNHRAEHVADARACLTAALGTPAPEPAAQPASEPTQPHTAHVVSDEHIRYGEGETP